MYKGIVGFLLGLTLAIGLGPVWIPFFKRLKFGQFIREDGPQAHLAKAGTPTFGGILFISAALVGALFLVKLEALDSFFPLFAMLGYGAIGFADDYLKVVRKQNEGLKPLQKMAGLALVTVLLYVFFASRLGVQVPFTNWQWQLGILHFLFFAFVAVAVTNAVNLTDGIDGLCGSVTLVVAVFFTALAGFKGMPTLMVVNAVVAGTLLGYLVYNWHPAKVFMGDTGSLALGGYVLANGFALDIAWFIPIFGLVYVVETLSVIIQVVYFKRTGGRFFKMAPIHHHFELLGWKEKQIAMTASGITLLLTILVSLVVLFF